MNWICLIFRFVECNFRQCLTVLNQENKILLKHPHLLICFYLKQDVLMKVYLWNWLIKYSVINNFPSLNSSMMKSWSANSFLTICYNHRINLYWHNSIWAIKSFNFYTLWQGTMLIQVNTQVYSFFFYHKFLSTFVNLS